VWKPGSTAEVRVRVTNLEQGRNVAGLVRELDSDLPGHAGVIARVSSAAALGRLGERDAGPYLVGQMGDESAKVRFFVAGALGSIGYREAIPELMTALGDSSRLVRMAAAESLGQLRAHEARPKLRELVRSDTDGWVRLYAARALAAMRDDQLTEMIQAGLASEGRFSRRRKEWRKLRDSD
jgi:HEAT repeat protein